VLGRNWPYYNRGMRFALTVVLAAACSQPVAPLRGRPGDVRGTAAIVPHVPDSPDRWRLNGSLDPDHPVAWVRIDLELQPRVELMVSVTTDGSRDGFDSEIYGVDGTLLATSATTPRLSGTDDIRDASLEAKGPVYVRIAATAKHPSGTYIVAAERGAPVVETPKVIPCDPEAFDSLNPLCKGECDFQHPDPRNRSCCALWEKCRIPSRPSCESAKLAWGSDDRIVIPLGLHQGIYGRPIAVLHLDQREPPVADEALQRRRREQIKMFPTKIDADRSTWELGRPEDHEVSWLRAHAFLLEVPLPLTCR
jgi:hypothetical protein